MTIQIIKLVTGEELIADVELSGDYVLKKPCYIQLIPSRSDPEQSMMALVPYAAYVEDHTIRVPVSNIIWQGTPVKEMYNQYNSIFGSGLVVPR